MGDLNPENPQDQDDGDSDPVRELEGMIQCLLNFTKYLIKYFCSYWCSSLQSGAENLQRKTLKELGLLKLIYFYQHDLDLEKPKRRRRVSDYTKGNAEEDTETKNSEEIL